MEESRIFPASKYIKDKLIERDWKQVDLARVLGRSPKKITDLMADNKRMSPEFAQELAVVFGETPEYWLNLDSAYALSRANYVDESIRHRSMVFSKFPFKDMQKRKWIADVKEAKELEDEFKRFFGVDSIEGDISVNAFYRRTIKESALNNAEKAWIVRARQLARVCPAEVFNEDNLTGLEMGLRRLAAKSQAVHRVPELLAKYGIRFVIVQPLPSVKIDGAALWLDDKSPTIAMSVRFDNIGSFWFTLMHEFFHIKHKDEFCFDVFEPSPSDDPSDDEEIRANNSAANALVPQEALEGFMKAFSPRYSEALINNFATQLRIHPGIIVGQLQYRNEIGYNQHRKLMVGIRDLVTTIAFTDGWGHPVPQV